MTKPSLKIEKYKLARILIWTVLGVAIAYQVYYLYGVRNKINAQEPPDHPVHVIKVDQVNLAKAAKRYKDSLNFSFALPALRDPFALNIPLKGVGQ